MFKRLINYSPFYIPLIIGSAIIFRYPNSNVCIGKYTDLCIPDKITSIYKPENICKECKMIKVTTVCYKCWIKQFR